MFDPEYTMHLPYYGTKKNSMFILLGYGRTKVGGVKTRLYWMKILDAKVAINFNIQ